MQNDKFIGRILKIPESGFLVVPIDRIPKLNKDSSWGVQGYMVMIIRGGSVPHETQGCKKYYDLEVIEKSEVKM